jgi:hypothetical protein
VSVVAGSQRTGVTPGIPTQAARPLLGGSGGKLPFRRIFCFDGLQNRMLSAIRYASGMTQHGENECLNEANNNPQALHIGGFD